MTYRYSHFIFTCFTSNITCFISSSGNICFSISGGSGEVIHNISRGMDIVGYIRGEDGSGGWVAYTYMSSV